MTLYEITTGRTGESYQRAYCWAAGVKEAVALFLATNPSDRVELVYQLFEDGAPPFCTAASDCGWPEAEKYVPTPPRA